MGGAVCRMTQSEYQTISNSHFFSFVQNDKNNIKNDRKLL